MSETREVLYEIKDKVASITINRPERRNALNSAVIAALTKYLDQAGDDPNVSAIILTGTGGNFCSGADLGGSFGGDQSFLDMHYDRGHYANLLMKMNSCKTPILAAIEGYCLAGGMGLCLSSDVAIASEDAQFGLPEIKRGLWPYMVTAVLIRNVGRKKALELCMTGDRIPAAEAERIGIINYSVPKDSFQQRVSEMAKKLSSFSPAVMGLGKSSFYKIADMAVDDALSYLHSQLTVNTQVEDLMEGVAAFMQKRDPVWKGR
ncbi:MAG: crotonase [Candidatus Abyssobacteria bacterium SURF_5]|uniref:Crotonase n=1 Tax=Abyssobacteria bacterium (strain SURF_5) TaxID=2093360 RepID=A0A3A4NM94_ABYX5|nr:MAG: crotonase [Candidatus Abyssubacteria bacterium SURF_5]